MIEDDLQRLLDTLPAADRYDVFVEECGDQDVRLRFSPPSGRDWSAAMLLGVVDTALRAAAARGSSIDSPLSHLNVTVLRPAQAADVIALSRAIRRDGDMVHAEAWLFSHAVVEPIVHATGSLRR